MSDIAIIEPIRGEPRKHAAGKTIARHCHRDGQFSVVLSGTMKIRSEAGWWLAPVGRGIWIPAGATHSAVYSEASEFILLKVPAAYAKTVSLEPCTIAVSGLLRELAFEFARSDRVEENGDYATLLSRVVLHQLRTSDLAPVLFLPAGRDQRLVRVIELLREAPALDEPLEELARRAGSSPRTMARLFRAETGMTFARWRDHLRIVTAMDMLSRGHSINETALDLGYQSQSSFTTMFSRIMGISPGRFIRQAG